VAMRAGHPKMHSRREELFISHHQGRQDDPDLLQVRAQPGIRYDDHAVFNRAFCECFTEVTFNIAQFNIEQFSETKRKYARVMSPDQFLHITILVNKTLVESKCVSCGSWIAAGPDEKYLAIAESAHQCPIC
jgi:hypothetical protein